MQNNEHARWTSTGESLDRSDGVNGDVSWSSNAGTAGPMLSFQQDLILGACNNDLPAAGGFEPPYGCINPHVEMRPNDELYIESQWDPANGRSQRGQEDDEQRDKKGDGLK